MFFFCVCVLQEMDNAPDLMDDTFLLAGRAAAYAPRMLLHETLLPLLLDTAMVRGPAPLFECALHDWCAWLSNLSVLSCSTMPANSVVVCCHCPAPCVCSWACWCSTERPAAACCPSS
jgi:hypothetical protein